MGEMGQALPAILFFLLGFSVLVAGIFVWQKKDDSAFGRAQESLKDLKADQAVDISMIKASLAKLGDEIAVLNDSIGTDFHDLDSKQDDISHKLEALDLEIKVLKEKQTVLAQKIMPRLHELTVKTQGPLQIEIVKPPALPKAKGVKVGTPKEVKPGSRTDSGANNGKPARKVSFV